MVNTTLTKGHHAQTWRTARIFFYVSHGSSMPNKNCTLIFLTGEDDIARFNSRWYNNFITIKFLHILLYIFTIMTGKTNVCAWTRCHTRNKVLNRDSHCWSAMRSSQRSLLSLSHSGVPPLSGSGGGGVGDLTPPYLWSIAVMYCGVAAKTGQAKMPGREPCLLCLHQRSSSRGRPFCHCCGFSVGGMDLRMWGWCHMCKSLPPTMSQLGGGHQLCPVGPATVLLDSLCLISRDWSLRPIHLALDLQISPFCFFTCQPVRHLWTMDWMAGRLSIYGLFLPQLAAAAHLHLPPDLEGWCHDRGIRLM